MTNGEMLFYGGILGMGVALLLAILLFVLLRHGRKKLQRKLDDEYGKQEDV